MDTTVLIRQLIEDCEEMESMIDHINVYVKDARNLVDYGVIHEMKGKLIDLADLEKRHRIKEEKMKKEERRVLKGILGLLDESQTEKVSGSLILHEMIMMTPEMLKKIDASLMDDDMKDALIRTLEQLEVI